jgi:hypothetical protein
MTNSSALTWHRTTRNLTCRLNAKPCLVPKWRVRVLEDCEQSSLKETRGFQKRRQCEMNCKRGPAALQVLISRLLLSPADTRKPWFREFQQPQSPSVCFAFIESFGIHPVSYSG